MKKRKTYKPYAWGCVWSRAKWGGQEWVDAWGWRIIHTGMRVEVTKIHHTYLERGAAVKGMKRAAASLGWELKFDDK